MKTKDFFAELFENANEVKRLTKERKDTLLTAEKMLLEAWSNAGDLKPVEIKTENNKYLIGKIISSHGFGCPEFETVGIAGWDGFNQMWNNGYWRYGNYAGLKDSEVLKYYKDFNTIVAIFNNWLKERVEMLKSLPEIQQL